MNKIHPSHTKKQLLHKKISKKIDITKKSINWYDNKNIPKIRIPIELDIQSIES